MDLRKELPKIAARVLHNTHTFPQNLKDKYSLIALAYGTAAVLTDFEAWCQEVRDKNPRYPITEYMKVVDTRLGNAFEEKRADLKDPRIVDITSLAYDLSGMLPSNRAVGNLLLLFEPDEIISAFREYVALLEEKDLKTGVRTFFTEGGAGAVIAARRRRNQ